MCIRDSLPSTDDAGSVEFSVFGAVRRKDEYKYGFAHIPTVVGRISLIARHVKHNFHFHNLYNQSRERSERVSNLVLTLKGGVQKLVRVVCVVKKTHGHI